MRVILNPYAGVDWGTAVRVKGNFHTHTTHSDGTQTPAAVIDRYHSFGYKALIVTDHDNLGQHGGVAAVWPWATYAEGRDPAALGILSGSGTELSWSHDIPAYFVNPDLWTPADVTDGTYKAKGDDPLKLIPEVGARGGLCHLAHPGRLEDGGKPDDWYADVLTAYPHCLGMEVFNQGNRYPTDTERWDRVTTLLRARGAVGVTAWGFSVDDSHRSAEIGRNYLVLMLAEFTVPALRAALTAGHFWIVWDQLGAGPARHWQASRPYIYSAAPTVSSVRVTSAGITVCAAQASAINWYTEGTTLVHTGDTLDLETPGLGSWVRAELLGDGGSHTLLQPFHLEPSSGGSLETDSLAMRYAGGSATVSSVIPPA